MRRLATAKASLWRQREAQLNEYRLHARSLFEEVSPQAEQIVPADRRRRSRTGGADGADAVAHADRTRPDPRALAGSRRTVSDDRRGPGKPAASMVRRSGSVTTRSSSPPARRRWIRVRGRGAVPGHLVMHSDYVTGDLRRPRPTSSPPSSLCLPSPWREPHATQSRQAPGPQNRDGLDSIRRTHPTRLHADDDHCSRQYPAVQDAQRQKDSAPPSPARSGLGPICVQLSKKHADTHAGRVNGQGSDSCRDCSDRGVSLRQGQSATSAGAQNSSCAAVTGRHRGRFATTRAPANVARLWHEMSGLESGAAATEPGSSKCGYRRSPRSIGGSPDVVVGQFGSSLFKWV